VRRVGKGGIGVMERCTNRPQEENYWRKSGKPYDRRSVQKFRKKWTEKNVCTVRKRAIWWVEQQ